MSTKNKIKIGTGAGYDGDRIEPAKRLAAHEDLDYLVFECLAERTIANAQRRKIENTGPGYSPLLESRMQAVLEDAQANNIKIISNMGAASPRAAKRKVIEVATDLGISNLTVAGISGSDVTDNFNKFQQQTFTGDPIGRYEEKCISANAYLGVDGILKALQSNADVILTGRVADPSLFLAPMIHEHGWNLDTADSDLIGQGIACAHLMECAGQVTGGYYADPEYKNVNELSNLGFPIAEVSPEGNIVITKLPDTGGKVTVNTAREQILYEVHDPSEYPTPDAVADFSRISLDQAGKDRINVSGAKSKAKPTNLKVNIGYEDSVIGEGQISYGGPGSRDRAKLAGKIVRERLEAADINLKDIRIDLIGINSLYEKEKRTSSTPQEVRLRVAGKCQTYTEAERIGREVQRLYTNGPAGGGGAVMNTQLMIGIVSTLIDRSIITPEVSINRI